MDVREGNVSLLKPCKSLRRSVVGEHKHCLAQPPFDAGRLEVSGKRQEPNTLAHCVDARDPDFSGRAQDRRPPSASALPAAAKEHVIGERTGHRGYR